MGEYPSFEKKGQLAHSLSDFLADLTLLSSRHGLGINENAEIYLMEFEDFSFSYSCNSDGRLQRL